MIAYILQSDLNKTNKQKMIRNELIITNEKF